MDESNIRFVIKLKNRVYVYPDYIRIDDGTLTEAQAIKQFNKKLIASFGKGIDYIKLVAYEQKLDANQNRRRETIIELDREQIMDRWIETLILDVE